MITIYRMISAFLLMSLLIQILMPMVANVMPPSVVAAYNNTALNMSTTFIGKLSVNQTTGTVQTSDGVFQQVMQQSYGSSLQNGTVKNSTGTGFFAGIEQFTGLAFVFPTIGYIGEALLQTPRGLMVLLSIAMSSTGVNPTLSFEMSFMFYTMLALSLTLVLISSWQKYDLRSG